MNINSQIKSLNEKEDITTIYKEIKKEKEVIKIELEKDKKYKSLKEGVESHESEFSKFRRSSQKTVKKMLKNQNKQPNQETFVIRNKRFAVDRDSEELNILREIKQISKEEKIAILEFYKSYLRAIQEKDNLLNKLGNIDSSSIEKKKVVDTSNFENNIIYLHKIKWPNTEIDLSNNNKEIVPKTLLSESFSELMKEKFKELEKEIEDFASPGLGELGYLTCSLWYSGSILLNRQSPCASKITRLKENQEVLKKAFEFTLLLQLLKDMKKSKVPSFQIIYEKDKRN